MKIFDHSFVVEAPLEMVSAFHADTSALKILNPPLVFVKLHRVDPMAEGSISEFTLWMGPLPIFWRAIHSNISPNGFTDIQDKGPLEYWKHTHRFDIVDENRTRISEHVEYKFASGWQGLLPRIIFSRLGLLMLFKYREWATKKNLEAEKTK